MQIISVFILIFLISLSLTGLVRYYSLRKAILDIPNERSSHTLPTPRGGGIAVAATFFLAISLLWGVGEISGNLAKALLGGGFLVAAAGYWDDLKSLSARTRACLHFLAAGWGVYCLGGFVSLDLGFVQLHLGWLGSLLAVIGIVWLINLYNFMDGIDGIAGSEALFVSLMGGIFLWLFGANNLALVCLFLFASVLGFLIWNWPPAKIFLGDVGSGLLGYIFAVLAIASSNQHQLSLWCWLALLAIFIFDASFTLIHRMLRGERWYSAHREHIYQRLVQKGASHARVTLLIIGANLFFILPMVMLMFSFQKISLAIFLFIGLVFLSIWMRIVQTSTNR